MAGIYIISLWAAPRASINRAPRARARRLGRAGQLAKRALANE
jgi:hypothetical protein